MLELKSLSGAQGAIWCRICQRSSTQPVCRGALNCNSTMPTKVQCQELLGESNCTNTQLSSREWIGFVQVVYIRSEISCAAILEAVEDAGFESELLSETAVTPPNAQVSLQCFHLYCTHRSVLRSHYLSTCVSFGYHSNIVLIFRLNAATDRVDSALNLITEGR